MAKTKTSSNVKKLVIMLLITFGLLIVFRLGAFITLPYIHSDILEQAAGQIDFGFLDVFTGGALSSYSVLCLGISPYITSSIIFCGNFAARFLRRRPIRALSAGRSL